MTSDTRSFPTQAAGVLDAASGDPLLDTQLTRREVLRGLNAGLVALGAGAAFPEGSFSQPANGQPGPRKVRPIETVWIPMSDGVKIATRIWLPEDAEQNPVPAIMEYIPYRRRDDTRLRNESMHGYLRLTVMPAYDRTSAAPGIQKDCRRTSTSNRSRTTASRSSPGSPGSPGAPARSACSVSWGGFSCLQVAARRPPALKAIITHCSTDDRYTDDAHFTGGCINECMIWWGSHTRPMVRDQPIPRSSAIVGARCG